MQRLEQSKRFHQRAPDNLRYRLQHPATTHLSISFLIRKGSGAVEKGLLRQLCPMADTSGYPLQTDHMSHHRHCDIQEKEEERPARLIVHGFWRQRHARLGVSNTQTSLTISVEGCKRGDLTSK